MERSLQCIIIKYTCYEICYFEDGIYLTEFVNKIFPKTEVHLKPQICISLSSIKINQCTYYPALSISCPFPSINPMLNISFTILIELLMWVFSMVRNHLLEWLWIHIPGNNKLQESFYLPVSRINFEKNTLYNKNGVHCQ